ncbi:SycD/LcrH family type III secretion system chaperone [Aquabacterium sp.]|uniref:SycD/LcrH family type III secretion system chaperone n=1 Tax=Aquabacterium sp. TaxID=1872578 RepID=UPI002CAD2E69|nr:SycD/LcrH family type III secretion system chaperone [Aquabacterium sp.]HSW06941.1 SycD/LcrH family type III secretion system chaperone [Aquabacterium sp.]
MSTHATSAGPRQQRVNEDTEALLRLLAEGGTLGSLMGLGADDLDALYALGLGYYGQARYTDAMKVFSRLVSYSHAEPRYLNALASAHQMLGHHERAVHYWGVSQLLDTSDPVPTFHTAQSLLALGLVNEAMEALDLVLRQCERQQRHGKLAVRAETLYALVRSKASAGTAAAEA